MLGFYILNFDLCNESIAPLCQMSMLPAHLVGKVEWELLGYLCKYAIYPG